MMTGTLARAFRTVKPHVPLIKFRKGGSTGGDVTSEMAANSALKEGSKKITSASAATSLPVIEDWQLPSKYCRPALDDKEIDSINSGGAY